MSMMFKAAYAALNSDLDTVGYSETSENESQNDYCCICLEVIPPEAKDVVGVNDEVVYDVLSIECKESMSQIVLGVLGSQHSDIMQVFQTICASCSKTIVDSYKFIQRSKANLKQFDNIITNLSDCFENVTDDIQNCQTMYVAINTADLAIEQVYDIRKVSKNVALNRYKFIVQQSELESERENNKNLSVKKVRRKPRERDFSTIFIKTHELMADPQSKIFQCRLCMKTYPTSGSLRLHFFSMHFKKDFQCSLCPRSFGTSGLLRTHEKESHCTITCDECGKRLLNRSSTIKRHLMAHRTRQSKICNRCGRMYKKNTDFIRHMNQNTCEVPSKMAGDYICVHCGKHCHFKHQLMTHIKFEHGDAPGYICDWCGRKCYNQSALKIHILKHTGVKNFECSDCGGKFVTRQSLIHHRRLHTGERPYPCNLCDQSFLSASRRKAHIERHHSGAVFECKLCDAKYSARRSLLKHKKRHNEESAESKGESTEITEES